MPATDLQLGHEGVGGPPGCSRRAFSSMRNLKTRSVI
jgi:hypothetical protein